ncbi:hypothetical protein PoB_005055700, partial [Plakobranchus ocellatus]
AKQHDAEIRRLFTRLVYDRLRKPSEYTSGAENLSKSTVQPTPEFWLHPDAHIPNEKTVSWQDPRVSQSGHVTTYPRNKKSIEIKDPSTGKDVTGELINSVRAVHTKEEFPCSERYLLLHASYILIAPLVALTLRKKY